MDIEDDLRMCAEELARSIAAARQEAQRQGIDPHRALTTTGQPILAPLLAAQANVLVALNSL